MPKCPICRTEQNTTVCDNCGFSELNIEFINTDEAQLWENTVLQQCRNVFHKMATKAAIDNSSPMIPFDKARIGCNVRIKDYDTSDVFCGKIIGADRRNISIQISGKLKAVVFDLPSLIKQDAIEYFYDADFKRKIEAVERLSEMFNFSNPLSKEPYRITYDDFISKNINSQAWCFSKDVIYYNELHQTPNTYFCAYDNPPFEIMNTIVSRVENKYTIKVTLRNLSKEIRNQPIKFRYRIVAPTMNSVHDWIDTTTPAPKYQTAIITFEYDGKEKPYFEIIN